jgi:hypothetical protein
MTISEQVEQLRRRLEDDDSGKFDTVEPYVDALNNARYKLARLIPLPYLEDTLAYTDENKSLTSGSLSLSDLSYNVLRGKTGILGVKENDGDWMVTGDTRDYFRDAAASTAGYYGQPTYYLFADSIKVLPTTITAIDVRYMKVPDDAYYNFDVTALSAGASATQFSLDSFTGIAATDDTYNGTVIYHVEQEEYHVITDYDYAGGSDDRLVTVSPSSSGTFATGNQIRFITDTFKYSNLSGITSELNPTFHEYEISLAAAELFAIVNKPQLSQYYNNQVTMELAMLNPRIKADETNSE